MKKGIFTPYTYEQALKIVKNHYKARTKAVCKIVLDHLQYSPNRVQILQQLSKTVSDESKIYSELGTLLDDENGAFYYDLAYYADFIDSFLIQENMGRWLPKQRKDNFFIACCPKCNKETELYWGKGSIATKYCWYCGEKNVGKPDTVKMRKKGTLLTGNSGGDFYIGGGYQAVDVSWFTCPVCHNTFDDNQPYPNFCSSCGIKFV